jgi:hypothetical protein
MINFLRKQVFAFNWQRAMAAAAGGNDWRAIEIFKRLKPPPKLTSICYAQCADCYYRLGLLNDADQMYLFAEKHENGDRENALNRRYIISYCRHFRNAIAKTQGQVDLPYDAKDLNAALGDPGVTPRLRDFYLPRPE